MMHTLSGRSRKVERKKGQRYSKEFRKQAVKRMSDCDNILQLSRELGIGRRLLYNWRNRLDESAPPAHAFPRIDPPQADH
jgi:transposase-like protein